jgi:hypothetical protein
MEFELLNGFTSLDFIDALAQEMDACCDGGRLVSELSHSQYETENDREIAAGSPDECHALEYRRTQAVQLL